MEAWGHNNVNEITPHLDLPWAQIIGLFLAAAISVWTWVVKKFGEQHIASIKDLATELKEMRKDISSLAARVSIVEVIQKHYKDE